MAARAFHVIQDENMDVRYGGASFARATNAAKTKKKAGLAGSKPLSNIKNSVKPFRAQYTQISQETVGHLNGRCGGASVARHGNSVHDTQKKKAGVSVGRRALADISNSKKLSVPGASVARQSNSRYTEKKAGLSIRRALTDISNSKKSSPYQAITTTFPKKLDDITEEQFLHNHQECIDITEEQFLHNHQECIDTMTRGPDLQSFFMALEFDDDFSMEPGTPHAHAKSSQSKVDFDSTPRFLEYEDVPEFLNDDQFLFRNRKFDSISSPSPSPGGYPSPSFELLRSP